MTLRKNNTEKYKISFCTVCMNRLHHLKKTLPKNIKDTLPYKNFEFVLLDYNSKDGLEQWVKVHMSKYLELGILTYIKTNKPDFFLMSHSKNIVAKKATGDIICNVDADNFIGKGFADYINKKLSTNNNSYLAVKKHFVSADFYGRICVFKNDFIAVTGYDENMTEYGFEDFDLRNRLDLLGKKVQYISNKRFFKVINHSLEKRIENGFNINNIKHLYIRHINHYSSELMYLLSNGIFYKFNVIINRLINSNSISNTFKENRKDDHRMTLENDILDTGKWFYDSRGITLENNNIITHFNVTNEIITCDENKLITYYECKKMDMIQEAVMFLAQAKNKMKMNYNKNNKLIRVNNFFGEM